MSWGREKVGDARVSRGRPRTSPPGTAVRLTAIAGRSKHPTDGPIAVEGGGSPRDVRREVADPPIEWMMSPAPRPIQIPTEREAPTAGARGRRAIATVHTSRSTSFSVATQVTVSRVEMRPRRLDRTNPVLTSRSTCPGRHRLGCGGKSSACVAIGKAGRKPPTGGDASRVMTYLGWTSHQP